MNQRLSVYEEALQKGEETTVIIANMKAAFAESKLIHKKEIESFQRQRSAVSFGFICFGINTMNISII